MHHVMEDEYDDKIVVMPLKGNGLYPRLLIRFVDKDGDEMDMALSERGVADFKRLLSLTIKRAEVLG